MVIESTALLREKVALITGAGSGIGRATARYLAEAGAKVVVADIDAIGGAQTVSGLREAGHEATFVQVDVTSEEQVQRMIDAALERYGRLDVLHNNAGVMTTHVSIEETPLQEWQRIINIDLTGVFLGCKYGVPALKKSGGGVIINTASQAGIRGFMGALHYSAAKGGVVILTRSLATLLQDDNIRVNCICPTIVDTPFLGVTPGPEREAMLARMNITGILKPEDIARVALFLATKAEFTGCAAIVHLTPKGRPKYLLAFEYKRTVLRGV